MRIIALLVLLAVLSVCFAQLSLDVAYGSSVEIQANSNVTLSIKRSELITSDVESTITIHSDRAVTVTVDKRTSLRSNLPTQYTLITAGVTTGVFIEKNDSSAQLTVTYQYKLSTAMVTALSLMNGFQSDAIQYDADANTYFALNAQMTGGDTLTFYPLDHAGNSSRIEFYVVAYNVALPRKGIFFRPLLCRRNETQRYELGDRLVLTVTAESDIYVSATQPNVTNPHPGVAAPSARAQAIAFITFHAEDARTRGQAVFQATFNYTYDAAVVAAKNINETTIRFAKFVNGAWQYQQNYQLDVNANVIIQSTTSFSDWAAYGESTSTPNPIGSQTEESGASSTTYSILAVLATLVIALLL